MAEALFGTATLQLASARCAAGQDYATLKSLHGKCAACWLLLLPSCCGHAATAAAPPRPH